MMIHYGMFSSIFNILSGSDVFHLPVYVVIMIVGCIIIMLHGLCNAILVCRGLYQLKFTYHLIPGVVLLSVNVIVILPYIDNCCVMIAFL